MKGHIFSISLLVVLLIGSFFACTEESTIPDAKIVVAGITLNKSDLSLEIGGKETLIPTILPAKATNKGFTWTSSKTSVATVSKTGEVTAVALGKATITVTTTDGNKTATAEVTVTQIAVTRVSLNKTALDLKVGAKEALTTTIVPTKATDKSVTWISNKVSVAKVSNTGEVTAITVGKATITVTTTDGSKTAMAEVTVSSTAAKPNAPTNLSASPIGITTTTIPLTWIAPNDKGKNPNHTIAKLTKYTVTYTSGSVTLTQIVTDTNGQDPVPSTTLTRLISGTTYSITVRATNTANLESPVSNLITTTTVSAETKPNAPTNLVSTSITTTTILLSWTAPSDKGKNPNNTNANLTKYTVTYTTGSIILTKIVTALTGQDPALNTTLTGLTSGATYSIKVRTTNTANLESSTSNLISTTTNSSLPKDDLGALVYGISQSASKTLPTEAEIDKINTAKIIFSGLNASSGATVALRYVNTNGVDTNNGTSWNNAKRGIKATLDAITDANANKIYLLLIGSGTYTPTTWVSMKNHVAIIGGFKASSDPIDSYDKANNATILSGDNTRQVFKNYSLDKRSGKSTAVLARVTVTNGKATGNTKGGAMYNTKSSPTITEVTFSNNASNKDGGAMYNYTSSPILTQVTFSSNNAALNGGGIFNTAASSPILTQVTFFGNSAGTSVSYGGGMYNTNSSPTITQVTFSGNSASLGGGFYSSGGTPIISSTIFWGNTKNDKTTSSQIGGTNTLTHSIVQGATTDTSKGISNINPNLVALANNDGFVQTMSIGATSSAKDKGLYFARKERLIYYSSDNTTWYTTPLLTGASVTLPNDAIKYTTDARGYSYSGRPDIGAYEYNGTAP